MHVYMTSHAKVKHMGVARGSGYANDPFLGNIFEFDREYP
jgi:hypothetical protein